MKIVVRSCAVLLVVFSSALAMAQTPEPAPSADAASAARRQEKIRRLLEATGAGELGVQMIDQMWASFKEAMPGVPEEFWTMMRAKVKPSDMVALVTPVYEKHLTEADIDALTAFFTSPIGKRFIEKQPLILADTMKIGQEWGERLAADVVEELKKKGYSTPQ